MFKKFLGLVLSVVLFSVALNIQTVIDWWRLQNYTPPAEIATLANESFFTNYGEQLFYVSEPEVSSKPDFAHQCPQEEKGLVLGCYTSDKIFVLSVKEPDLSGVMEVTAAHEILHAAYQRLDSRTKNRVDSLLNGYYQNSADKSTKELIAQYDANNHGSSDVRSNELHSILATQEKNLPSDLEDYYSRYFKDRQQIVKLYDDYESVFIAIEKKITNLKDSMSRLDNQLKQTESQLNADKQRLADMNNKMNSYLSSDNTQAYNNMVPQYNAVVNEYNNLVQRYKTLSAQYNSLVDQHNKLVLRQNQLVESLDSSKYKQL